MSTKKLQIVGLDIPQSDWNQTDDTKLDYIKNKPTLEGLATETYVDNSISDNNTKVASAITNTISGGEQVIQIYDVSPLEHKCSCRLTSDVSTSRNIYKFDSSNMFLDDTYYPITYTINDNGTITVNGHTQDYYTELSISLKGLTIGETYTLSLRFPDGSLQLPQIVFFKDVNGEEIGSSMEFMRTYYTFRHDNEAIDCYEVHFPVYATPEETFVNATLYPQLELGDVATEWEEFSEPKPAITDFTTVKVNVNGKTYTSTADGMVSNIVSASPTMEITTDNEHVNICDFTYCVDTKKYVDNNATSADFIIVTNELPETGESNKLYLVPKADSQEQDLFDEFIWVNNTWEWIATKQIEVDLTDYVKNTDYATKDKAGVIKINSIHGVSIYNGELMIERANASEIAAKKLDRNPITPAYLDIAVKTGITTNTIQLTEEEKTSACEWLGVDGLVGDIDEALDEIIEIQESLKDGYTGGTGGGGVSSWNDLTDKPFGTEEAWQELLPTTALPFTLEDGMSGFQTTPTTEMVEMYQGEWSKAIVVWDGVEYECEPKMLGGILKCIGNVEFIEGTGDSGEPFAILFDGDGVLMGSSAVVVASIEDTMNGVASSTHSIGVSLLVETIHPIDIKFIPNDLYTEIDQRIENYINEALGGDY